MHQQARKNKKNGKWTVKRRGTTRCFSKQKGIALELVLEWLWAHEHGGMAASQRKVKKAMTQLIRILEASILAGGRDTITRGLPWNVITR